jgi:hypothetical protein
VPGGTLPCRARPRRAQWRLAPPRRAAPVPCAARSL